MGEKGFGVSMTDPNKFGWESGKGLDLNASFQALNQERPGANATLDFLQHTATNAILSSKEVQDAAKRGGVEPPKTAGRRGAPQLDTIAGLIRGGLQTRIYYVSVSGFDTHANQIDQHGRLLEQFSGAMAGFQARLEADGTADRVTTMVFSEFGRRVHENGSGGTDHGTAAPLFLMGNHVKAGIHGKTPSLTDLDDGDLKHTVRLPRCLRFGHRQLVRGGFCEGAWQEVRSRRRDCVSGTGENIPVDVEDDDAPQGRLLSRKEVLAIFGGAAAFLLAPRAPAAGAPCVALPELTEGPFFVDERLDRADIRVDPADGSTREGAPVEADFHCVAHDAGRLQAPARRDA
jgi:hypothetical protein